MSDTPRRFVVALAACLTLTALFAAPALAAPDPAYTVSPAQPRCGDSATYTDASTFDPLLSAAKVEWDFDNNGVYEVVDEAAPFETAHTYTTRGTKTFGMKVTDNNAPLAGATEEDQTVGVVTAAPQASFTVSDPSPLVDSEILFASDASDPDGDAIAGYAWDFDNDGTTDSTQRNPTHRYTTAGEKRALLRVTDSCGATSAAAVRDVIVRGPPVPGNDQPVASFTYVPRTGVRVGDPVSFVSRSYDRQGPLRAQAWDLDGDGQFDDGREADVVYTFSSEGIKTVALEVTDSAGATEVQKAVIQVDKRPKPPPGTLRPFPFIRFRGLVLARGARVKVLSVRAPKGATIAVRCKGKGCGVKQRRKRARTGGSVHFKTYERFLRAGIRLDIFVRKPGTIGAFTRYTIRAGKGPVRIDRCLPSGPKTKPKKRC